MCHGSGCQFEKEDGPNKGACERWKFKATCPMDDDDSEEDEEGEDSDGVLELDFEGGGGFWN